MNRAATIAGLVLGGGILVYALTRRDNYAVPQFSYAELSQLIDSQGYLNLPPAFKPAQSAGSDAFFDFMDENGIVPFIPRSGLSGGDFDWGDWATSYEYWGPQTILPDSLPMENEMENVYQMDVNELIAAVAEHLKQEEGFSSIIYDDATGKPWAVSKRGNPTIGFGHLVTKADVANFGWDWTVNEAEAYALLLSDVNSHLAPIVPEVHIPLTLNQWIAITSLAFNAGPNAVKKSTFLKRVNEKNWPSAQANFKDWNKATVTVDGQKVKREVRGLTLRREREWALFESPSTVVMLSGSSYA